MFYVICIFLRVYMQAVEVSHLHMFTLTEMHTLDLLGYFRNPLGVNNHITRALRKIDSNKGGQGSSSNV